MITLGNKLITCFDVDNTLIKWLNKGDALASNKSVEIKLGKTFISEKYAGNISNLINHSRRGHYIIVWSAGGGEWAAAAVKALGIEQYVNICMKKPEWYYDDTHCSEWMGEPLFIKE